MDNTTQNQNANNNTTIPENNPAPLQAQPTQPVKKPAGLIIITVICAILAVAGIAFGVYELMESGQKDQQILNLKTEVDNKNVEISELETKISDLSKKSEAIYSEPDAIGESEETYCESEIASPESTTDENSETAKIKLGEILDESEMRTAFKIGECTADSPSVKCPVEVNGKQGLISYISTDNVLRLVIPKE